MKVTRFWFHFLTVIKRNNFLWIRARRVFTQIPNFMFVLPPVAELREWFWMSPPALDMKKILEIEIIRNLATLLPREK